MLNFHQKLVKTRKNHRFLTLSFHCITLTLICQAFWPFSGVFATSSVNNFYFDDYKADYYLRKDADGHSKLRVVEEFTAVFPSKNQNHGITRVIPYTNQGGKNLTMRGSNIVIFHNGTIERPYKIENGDGYYTVYIGDPDLYVNGKQVYRLEYEFENVITEFNDDGRSWQELYWDTNGNDWSQRFNQVTATVHLNSAEVAKAYAGQAWCYVGKYGASDQSRCQIEQIDDQTIQFSAKKLAAGENLTFDLEFQPGTFTMPAKVYDYRILAVVIVEVIIGIVLLFWLIYLLRKTAAKRSFYDGYFVKPEYTPPAGFTVAEMAENYLSKGRLGSSKVATLMELAVTGKIELIKEDKKTKLGRNATLWKIHIKSLNLTPEQVTILQILIGHKRALNIGQEIEIVSHTADSELIKLGTDFSEQVDKAVETKGLKLNTKKRATKSHVGLVVGLLFCVCIGSVMGLIALLEAIGSYRVIVGGVPLIVLAFALPWVYLFGSIFIGNKYDPYFKYTEKGLEYSRYMDGLKLYIKMAEQERIKFLQSVEGADTSNQGIVKLYEKLLPYAVLFRLEKSWAKEMGKYYEMQDVDAPVWYIGAGAFSAQAFSDTIKAASTTMNSNIAHSTTSSSSSGSSGGGGGGFSGGGGGGGGGGGW